MKYQACESKRVARVSGKVSDMCSVVVKSDGIYHNGGAPFGINFGGGDYLEFEICLDCGIVQGSWPARIEE